MNKKQLFVIGILVAVALWLTFDSLLPGLAWGIGFTIGVMLRNKNIIILSKIDINEGD